MTDHTWTHLMRCSGIYAGWPIIISAIVYHAIAHKPLAWDVLLFAAWSLITFFALREYRKHRP